jgi:FSR family fosmidomycin resistance protein-like MFS transporter
MLAMVQDTDTEHPAFVNGIYMTVNFGISSLIVLLIGGLGDTWGLDVTYKVCAIAALGAVPFVMALKK